MKSISKLLSFFMFPTLVLLIHIVLSKVLDLYTIYPDLDIPVHYAGGFSIAYAATRILTDLEKEKWNVVLNRVIFLTLIVSLTATATVFWEFAEFIADKFMTMNVQVSLANTMQDQFMGILGGVTWVLIYIGKETRQLQI